MTTTTLLPEHGPWVSYEPPPPRPPYRRWWFWTSLVLVVVAVVALVSVLNVRAQDAKRAAAWREFRSHSHVVTLDVYGRGSASIAVFLTPGLMTDSGATKIYERRLPFHLRTRVGGHFDDYGVLAMSDDPSGRVTCQVRLDGRHYVLPDNGGGEGFCDVSASQAIG